MICTCSSVHGLMQGCSQWVYRVYDDMDEQAFSSCLSENGSDAEENRCANGTGTVVYLAVAVVAVVSVVVGWVCVLVWIFCSDTKPRWWLIWTKLCGVLHALPVSTWISSIVWFPLTSQKHACNWIGYTKLPAGWVDKCERVCEYSLDGTPAHVHSFLRIGSGSTTPLTKIKLLLKMNK